jgi:raffinose/stachyose/melibiose transport system substrate-binding protein
MKKRIFSLLMTSVLTMSMITGCGASKNTDTKDTQTDNNTTESSAETDSSEPVSISFYTTETGKDDVFQDVI